MVDVNIMDYADEVTPAAVPIEPETAQAQPETPTVDVHPAPKAEPVKPMSFGESFEFSLKNDTLPGMAWQRLTDPDFEDDPDFSLTYGDILNKWGKGIPEEYHDTLAESHSEAELQYRRDQILQRMEDQRRQDAMPIDQWAYSKGTADMLDPVGMGLAFLSGGATRFLPTALREIAAVRVATGAALGAGETLANQAAIDAVDPINDIKDAQYGFMTAVGAGMGALGGGLDLRSERKAFSEAVAKDMKRIELEHLNDIGSPLTEKGKAYYAPVEQHPFNIDDISPEVTAMAPARISMTAQLKNSANTDGYIHLGNILGEDGLANKSGKPLQPTMALDADIRIGQNLGDALRGINEGYTQWGKETNAANWLGRQYQKGRDTFNEELGMVMRGINEPPTAGHAKAAQAVRKVFSRQLQEAKELGVKGFGDIPDNPNYLPRIMRTDKIREAAVKYGKDNVVDFLTASLKSNNPELQDDYAKTIAKAWFNRGHEVRLGDEVRFGAALSGEDGTMLRQMLTDDGLPAENADRIVAYFQDKCKGGIPRSKRRIDFDEKYQDPETGLRFTDLVENNVEKLVTIYTHQVGGATAMAKFGFDSPSALEAHLDKVKREAIDSGKMTADQIAAMDRKARNIMDQILGRPVEGYTELKALAQGIMDYNYIRVGGGFSLASVPETFLTVAENGLKATLDRVPALNKMFKRAAEGEMDGELLDLVESFGIGRDIDLINSFVRNPEDDFLATHGSLFNNRLKNNTVRTLSVAKRAVGLMSGLPHLTRFAQVFAAKSTIQRMTNTAFKNKALTKKWAAQLGLDEVMQQKVFEGIRKYAKTERGMFTGRKVRNIDWQQWRRDDYDTAERFKYSVVRATNRLIQKQLPGELPEFMSKTAGRMAFQFMSFGLAAYEKKTLNAFHRRDLQTATAVALLSTLGSLTYVAQMYAQSTAQDDPKRFLKERLSRDQIIKAGVQRSGFLSVLPPVIDSAASIVGLGPLFNQYARTSGLPTNFTSGNPTVSLVNSAIDSAKLPAKAIKGDRINEKDIRTLTNLAPLRTLPVMQQLYEALINHFPKNKKEK